MITCEVRDGVARIVIRRHDDGNALTTDMVKTLRNIFSDSSIARIVTLTGDGADFSLGRDRNEPKSGTPYDAFSLITDLNACISNFPGIVISAIRGRAFGLGVGLVMRSDIAIASDDAKFALDEVKLGIPPMFIMAAIGDHLAPKHALDAVLTSREFSAEEALRIGLISRVVQSNHLDRSLETIIGELSRRAPQVLLACKQYFRTVSRLPSDARAAFALVEQTGFAMSQH